MHDRRNAALAILLAATAFWAVCAWLVAPDLLSSIPPGLMWHRVASVAVGTLLAVFLFFQMLAERSR